MSTSASNKPHSLNVVVLAAGKGERFLAEGVTVPKPLISWKGRTLLEHSLDVAKDLAYPDGRIVVVATDAVAGAAKYELRQRGLNRTRGFVVAVSVIQPGPVASGLLALAHLPLNEPVAFMDCDNHYADRSWVRRARDIAAKGEGFITVAPLRPGMVRTDYCNVGVGEDGMVYRIAEKQAMSGDAALGTGIYGFYDARVFAHEARQLNPLTPMSLICSNAAPLGGFNAILVDGWQPLGTPSQLALAK